MLILPPRGVSLGLRATRQTLPRFIYSTWGLAAQARALLPESMAPWAGAAVGVPSSLRARRLAAHRGVRAHVADLVKFREN